jgi:hypothetical protein
MHLGRQLPNRLAPLAACALAACVSDRYVGSIGPDGVYSNRGYGFALRTNPDELATRWRVVDPPHPEHQQIHDEPLDLNGDGELRFDENTHYLTPTLRFYSKTSTGASITFDVEILGGKSKTFALDDLVIPEVRHLTKTASIAGQIEKRSVSTYDARLAETPKGANGWAYRIVIIDHADFISEQERKRRQLYRIELAASEITDQMRADLDLLLSSLYLNHHAGEETTQEKW